MKARDPGVYILASKRNGTIYTGMSGFLRSRIRQHKRGESDGFAKQMGANILVYFEEHDRVTDAIRREKQLKAWRREWKVELIEGMNPGWLALSEQLLLGSYQAVDLVAPQPRPANIDRGQGAKASHSGA